MNTSATLLTSEQALQDLQTLIRFDTTNPPGNEMAAASWIVERLRAAGLEPEVLSSAGRPNVLVRIPGDGSAGGPLLLTGHIDVVAVDREHWTHDPFAADIADGYLWGRGAIDMKYMVIYCLHATMRIAASGRKPGRDIIFAAVSDEEAGCTHGSKFLVEQHPDKVRATHMLGEFGGFSQDGNGVRFYPVQVAEKGVCQMYLRAKGDPGHGSIPIAANAVTRLSEAVALLGRKRLPRHPTDTVREFVSAMAAAQKPPARQVLMQVLNPLIGDAILDRVMPDKSVADTLNAALRNTVTPTMLQAGAQKNVIPSLATATLDGRLIPGQTKDDLWREMQAVIGTEYEHEIITYAQGRENKGFASDPVYKAICDNIRLTDPTGIPVPYMLTGFTDAQQFGRLGMQCYGYAPIRFPVQDNIRFARLVHGHDERIHVEGFHWGVEAFCKLVNRLVGLG